MKKILLILTLAAPTLFAQTNDIPVVAVSTNGPIITAIDGYAAQVDSTIITYGEIRDSVAPYMQQLLQQYKGEELAQQIQSAYLEARDTLIEEALIKEEAKALGLALSPDAIDEEINRMIRERFNDDRTQLNRALTARRMTFDEWREEIADQLTLRVYYNREVTRRTNVSAEQVRSAYDQTKENYFIPFKVKFSAILINKGTTEEDRVVKKQQAENVLKKLTDGADFAKTAKEVSEGIRAAKGGAFPWSDPKDIRAELRSALYTVATGQISGLIETDAEFYIVKVQERREEGYVPFDDVRKPIEADLLRIDQQRLHANLIERLTAKHFIKRY